MPLLSYMSRSRQTDANAGFMVLLKPNIADKSKGETTFRNMRQAKWSGDQQADIN